MKRSPPIDEAESAPQGPRVSFVELWQRIAHAATRELAESFREYDEAVYRDLGDDLVTRLSVVAEAALWQEFDARRNPAQIVFAHLAEQAPVRTVYCGFLEGLRGDGLRSLMATYPVLQRHVSTTVGQWRAASHELLSRVRDDHAVLVRAFELPANAQLVGVRQDLSDPHHGGRMAALLTFASPGTLSEERRVVYKPKDLRIDGALQRLLSELPLSAPDDAPLRSIEVVARDGYGYMEWVAHKVCATDEALAAFYRNAGRLAAVLYLLGCTDCHFENLIAHGDQLVLIDAETLFEGVPDEPPGEQRASTARTALHEQMSRSVIRLGLLPQWQVAGEQRMARDVSALGLEPPKHSRRKVAGWIALNSDGMLAGEIEEDISLATSLPVGIGSPNRLADFVDEFCDGVERQLHAISAQKSHWLDDEHGPLATFTAYRRRFVRRPTWLYLWLRTQLLQPESLTSEEAQRQVLGNLTQTQLVSATPMRSWPLFTSEVAQMEQLDVPFFEQPVDGAEVIAPDGSTIADYFRISGYAYARTRVEELDEESIALQLRLIRGVIAAKQIRAHRPDGPGRRASPVLDMPSNDDRRREAEKLGDLLVETAIADDSGAVEWLAIDAAEDFDRSNYGPLGPSVYSGRSGIALFLAALARSDASNAATYRDTAIGACSDLRDLPDDGARWWRDQPLGLAGCGGLLLALAHMRDLVPDLSGQLLDALDIELLRSTDQLDVIFGCAGLIGPLLMIGSPRALALAREAGNTLVERQDPSGGWRTDTLAPRPLTGFSHGASGMAAALAQLHAQTAHGAYLGAAARALRYEREQFDVAVGNWPDFRGDDQAEGSTFMLSWCHGAPGIALARLCMRHTPLWDQQVEADLRLALSTTADGMLDGDSLCCGRLGAAAILRLAAAQTAERRWLDAAVQLEAQSLARKRAAGRYSFSDIPGLFQGAAGVGLALLDHEPALLPSLLSAGLCAWYSMPSLDDAFETTIRRVVREELSAFTSTNGGSNLTVAKSERVPDRAAKQLDVADRFALQPYVVHVLKEAGGGPMACKDIADRVYELGFQHKWPPKYADQLTRSINALASPSQHPERFERVGPRVLKLR